MAIGLGIVLIIAGAALMWAVNVDLSFIDDFAMGLILLIAGILAIALSLILSAQRRRTSVVEERRYDGPPTTYDDRL